MTASRRTPQPEPLLAVRDLRTYFLNDEDVLRAVDGVSFSLDEGERIGLVGESGSGKTVTALSIMGLLDRAAGQVVGGEILYRGRDLVALDEAELRRIRGGDIAMVFQDPMTSLDPVYTIGDQLVETIKLHRGLGRRLARKAALEALEAVQVPEASRRFDDYPHQFSGGMRQRVVIAIALSCNPSILIADEPTTALDVTTQAEILELMRTLSHDFGTAVVLITHDLGIVAGFCETVHVMYAGRIVEAGAVEDVFLRPQHPYTWGLLNSVSRLDRAKTRRLHSIPGSPPSLADPARGCPFHPRCAFATDHSRSETPELRRVSDTHVVACHYAGELDLASGEAES